MALATGSACSLLHGEDVCGDGQWGPLEVCDPGLRDHVGYCTAQCEWNVCGDGVQGPGEACDPPDGGATCDHDCSAPGCGNGAGVPGELCFDERTVLAVGSDPRGLTLADIDEDGDLDLLTANHGDGTVTVLVNNDGVFSTGVSVDVGQAPVAVLMFAFDDTLRPDLFVALESDGGRVARLLATPLGYGEPEMFPLSGAPTSFVVKPEGRILHVAVEGHGLQVLDFNRNDTPVGTTPEWSPQSVTDVWISEHDPVLGRRNLWLSSPDANELWRVDAQYTNVDGQRDAFALQHAPGPMALLLESSQTDPTLVTLTSGDTIEGVRPSGILFNPVPVPGATAFAAGNLDGVGFGPRPNEGIDDLVIAVGNRIGILFDTGPQLSGYQDPVWLETSDEIGQIALADLDGNGFNDILTTHPATNQVTILWSYP